MEVIDILLILLLIIFSVLGIYLIIVVKKLSSAIDKIEKELAEFKDEAAPLIVEITEFTKSATSIAKLVEDQVDFFNDKIEWAKSKLNLSSDSNTKSPHENAYQMISNLKAISKGLATFIKEIKK